MPLLSSTFCTHFFAPVRAGVVLTRSSGGTFPCCAPPRYSSLTLDELDAASFLKLKRGYWIIDSRLHRARDVTLGEDQSRVRKCYMGTGDSIR